MTTKQDPKVLPLVLRYFDQHSYGVTYRELLQALAAEAPAADINAALEWAVDMGEVRYTYRPGPPDPEWNRSVDLVFSHALNLLLPVAAPAEVDMVIDYFAQREDYGRFGEGPAVTLEVAEVFRGLADKLPVPKIAYVLALLRREDLLKFTAREKNGYVTVTLAGTRKFTVMALEKMDPPYYGASPSYQLRCFHVRAGTPEMACEKVVASAGIETTLTPQAVAEGVVNYKALPGMPALDIKQL